MNKPWERQPGETAKAYAAFLHYRDLPAIDRSVAAARERQERDRKGTLRQWNGWSMHNGWVNRAAEHDSDLASPSPRAHGEGDGAVPGRCADTD